MMTSNDRLARLAGMLYLLLLPIAGFGFFGAARLVVAGDPAATLANIQTSRTLFESTILVGAAAFVLYLVVALVLYQLFSAVSKSAASLMLAFAAVSVPLSLAALARRSDVLSLLDLSRLSALGSDYLPAQVMVALQSSDSLMRMSVIFWGLWLFPLGWLVFRSGFAPRTLGVLLMLGGFFYVFAFGGTVLNPAYDTTLVARITGIVSGVPDMAGELGLGLWLLIMGARERKTAARPDALGVSSLSAATR
jgi:hypothetical protein